MSFNFKQEKPINFVYITKNTKNNKYYIGIHSTDKIEDGYLGSGKAIKAAIKFYGKEYFNRTIIEYTENRKDLLEAEKKWVTEEIINDKNSYNMALGGVSSIDSLRKIMTNEEFKNHQIKAGKIGGARRRSAMSDIEKKEWHSSGGKKTMSMYRDKLLRRLKEEHSIPVLVFRKSDLSLVGEFPSIRNAADALGFDISNASKVLSGKCRSVKGYILMHQKKMVLQKVVN